MNKIHKAYLALGLEPGTSFDSVKSRHKQLVLVWHPDRMHGEAGAHDAEEELKKINQNFDILKMHFDKSNQHDSTCECHPDHAAGSNQQESNVHDADQTQEQTEQARADAKKVREQKIFVTLAKRATQDAVNDTQLRKDNRLRWQLSLLLAGSFVIVIGFAWAGVAGRQLFIDNRLYALPLFQSEAARSLYTAGHNFAYGEPEEDPINQLVQSVRSQRAYSVPGHAYFNPNRYQSYSSYRTQ